MAFQASQLDPARLLSGSRESIAALVDGVDWSATPVGPRESWPQELRSALALTLASRFPMVVMWGSELVLLYNASYAPMLGAKHPWAMGRRIADVWPEIWPTIGPMLQGVRSTGEATYSEDMLLPLLRNGYLEECYFTFSFSPIAEDGEVRGIFCAVAETSSKVIAERRLRTLYALESRSLDEVMKANPIDLPFSRIYLAGQHGRPALLESSGPSAADGEAWPVAEVARTGLPRVVASVVQATATLIEPAPVQSAVVLPLEAAGRRETIGAMVIGLSPFSRLDDRYRAFLRLLAARIAVEIGSTRANEERERAATDAVEARDAAMRNERALRVLADAVPQIIYTGDAQGRVHYFNSRWFDLTGLTAAESFEGDGWLRAFHPEDRAAVRAAWNAAAAGSSDVTLEARIASRERDYSWYLMRASALHGDDGSVARIFATAIDINERKRIEERERFLAYASDVLASTLDVRAILERITELCVPQFADWCQVQSLSPDGELVVEAVRHSDPELNPVLEGLIGHAAVAMRDASPGSPQVLRQARSRVLDHEATLRAVRENVPVAEDRAIYEKAGLGTALIVPLVARGQTRGTLHLVNVDSRSSRSEIAVEVAEDLARRAALAIDNSRLYEREHRVATALQRAMLPARLPTHPLLELSYAYRPAERQSRVGGDWYDAFAISEGRIAISIGDVAGHGLEASVAMNEARQSLRVSAIERLSPAQTLRRTNAAVMLGEEPSMITAIYGVIDLERAVFSYSCAGHPPPALAPFAHRARYLEGGGIPIGVDPDALFPSHEIELPPYSTLLLYTDGLIEFDRNLEREAGRLLDALDDRVQDTGPDAATMLLRRVLNNRQIDDIAVLSATILPRAAGSIELRLKAEPTSATIARRFVSRYARVARLGPERAFDLVLAVGEAVANAVEHAYRGATGDFVLRLDARDDKIFGEVQDLGTWRESPPSPERGRGLAILRATTRRFDLNRSPDGTTVVFAV